MVPLGVPFVLLRNIGLEQRHGQRRFTGFGDPLCGFEHRAAAPQGDQYHCIGRARDGFAAAPREKQAGAGQRADERQAEYARYRGPARYPGIHMGVAQIEPGKTGEQPVTQPLEQHPQCREPHQHAARQGAHKLHIAPGEQRMKQCQRRAKQRGQSGCQRNTGMAVDMDADVDPGNTAAKHAQTVQPAAPQALLGRCRYSADRHT